jgi:ribonuclease HI
MSDQTELQGSGYDLKSRNNINRLELRAVVEGLERLLDPTKVTVYTDSTYVIVGAKKPSTSYQFTGALWKRFLVQRIKHDLEIVKVGIHPDHRRAHHLAREALFNAFT